jgi:radical SAM protein with 4Fe4S-binding SPASM domain
VFPLRLLALNLTRRCNLSCAHCYLDAETQPHATRGELTTIEVCDLLTDAAGCGDGIMVVLTGGEPLLRLDLEDIVAHGVRLGLAMVVGSNGTMLTARRVASLQRAGLLGAGISVDSLDPGKHDSFRGKPGSWLRTMAGIEECRRQGLSFQLHFSATDANVDEIPAMIDFAAASGARVLNVFFLVCTGRGTQFTDLSAQRYESVLGELVDAQAQNPGLIIRPRCAPQFKRVALQRLPDAPINRISGRDSDGCIAGTHYCRVTPDGAVTACPYMEDEVGNIRSRSFADIWGNSPLFARLRRPELGGACGRCEFRKLCGGCRARSVAAGSDVMGADPFCAYLPVGGAVIEPLDDRAGAGLCWTRQAESRISRVPGFLRQMVRRRAEAYVLELGDDEVTTGHLDALTARRFGGAGPRRPQS